MASDFSVELFWSFRSPYSYLVLPRVLALAEQHGVHWQVRIVYPLAVRYPDHFKKMHPLARPYFYRDSQRVAEFLGMPFRRPVPDPIVQDPLTLEISPQQPHIRRLTWLGIEAERRGRGLEFMREVSRLLWDGSVDDWHLGEHLAHAAARAGLDLAQLQAAIDAAPEQYEAQVEANQEAQYAAGHWGVPLMVYQGEPFFGQDRFDLLVWRLNQSGLGQADLTQETAS